MFGLIVGTLCLIALIATVRRRRYGRLFHAYRGFGGYGPWYHDFADYGYGAGPGFGYRRRGFLRAVLMRLDTTPGQEKAIRQALELARDRVWATRTDFEDARRQLAAALGGDILDREALEASLAQHTALFGKLAAELANALASIHEALDPTQRRRLAEMIADGSFGPGGYGPHFHAC